MQPLVMGEISDMARNKTSGKGAEKKVAMKKTPQKSARPATIAKAPPKPVAKPPVKAAPAKVETKVEAAKKPAAPVGAKKPVAAKPAPAPVAQAPAKVGAPAQSKVAAPAQAKAPAPSQPKVAPPVQGKVAVASKAAPVAKPAHAPKAAAVAPKMPAVPPQAARAPAGAPARAMPASAKSHAQAITGSAAPQQAAAAKAAADKAAAAAAAAKKNVNQRHGFKLSEWIVYPAHGVGRIVGIEEQEIAGISLELFVITFEKDKMTLRVPTGKSQSVGMRKLAEENTVKRAMETLKGKARVKRTMWSRRAQEYEAKINSGDLIAIAEVVRDLYRSESQPEQSYSERQLYEAALDRMAREIAAVEKLDERGAVQRITDVLSKSAKGRRLAAEEAEIKAA
jgi:CarD family transcriptional regulator